MRNGVEPSVPLCEQFLRQQLDALNAEGAHRVSITLLGIGECFASVEIVGLQGVCLKAL